MKIWMNEKNILKAARTRAEFAFHRTIPTTPTSIHTTCTRAAKPTSSRRTMSSKTRPVQPSSRPRWDPRESSRKKCRQSARITTKNRCCCRATRNRAERGSEQIWLGADKHPINERIVLRGKRAIFNWKVAEVIVTSPVNQNLFNVPEFHCDENGKLCLASLKIN